MSLADVVAPGLSEVIAGVMPAGKVDAIKQLQDAGRVVAMAGDGVNDAAALAQADLGPGHAHRSRRGHRSLRLRRFQPAPYYR